MGASSWHYYTPHGPDPEAALQSLRADVFIRGEYTDPTGPLAETLRATARRFGRDPDSADVQAEIENATRLQQAIQTGATVGLGKAEQGVVKRLRAIDELARQLGAESPAPTGSPPGSIAELLERAAESGTHSILDIEHVDERPGFGVATAMDVASLRRVFGSTQPLRDQVEKHWSEVAERLDPWHARYCVVYYDERPHEYAFIGCSGD